jgi:hypothetical protein
VEIVSSDDCAIEHFNGKQNLEMDHEEDPTMREGTRDRPHDHLQPYQLPPLNYTMTSLK